MWFFRNLFLWFVLHMICVYLCHKLPDAFYRKDLFYFRSLPFEAQGFFYERFFRVKKWKSILPDGGKINRYGFEKKKLSALSIAYLEQFHLETKRAELIHVTGLATSLIFICIHEFPFGLLVFIVAAFLDLPFILIQRYNRPRLDRLIQKKRGT